MYYLNFDGGCMPRNPGGIAIGSWVIRDHAGAIVETGAQEVCRGDGATNNVAEWAGLVFGLEAIAKHTSDTIDIKGDSQLIINQLNGSYKVRQEHLKPWKEQALKILELFKNWKATHVKREFNEEADKVGNDKYTEIIKHETKRT